MEAKPFSLQSPEKVAEAYGGNKQKIAQAIQMGALDPTSGLLAGMFIDRMRSAQAMEQAPQQSVAQKVFAPPAPPPAPAGLGAIGPQGGGMPAPQGPQVASAAPMGMPAPMGQPPVGMAAGGMTELPDSYGLESLPIPDNMYNEESFAGGGIVAFAGGGLQDQIARLEAILKDPNASADKKLSASIELRSMRSALGDPEKFRANMARMRGPIPTFAERTAGGGKPLLNEYLSKGEVDFNPEEAMMRASTTPTVAPPAYKSDLSSVNMTPYNPEASSPEAQLNAILGKSAPAPGLPSLLASQEVPSPAPRADRGVADVAGGATRTPAGATAPAAGTTPEMSDEDIAEKRMQDFLAAAKPPAPKGTTDEEKAARKNEDLWSALAQIGFGMAAGESPNFLTNVGKATAAAVPGMQESLKERRADTKEELKQKYAYELAQAGLSSEAYKLKLSQFDRLEDNRYRKETLDEQKRSNRRREELQGQQIAATGAAADKLTGTERMVRLIAAGNAPGATDEAKQLGQAATLAIRGYGETTAYGNLADKANDNVEKLLTNPMSPEARKMRGLKKDPEAAATYRAELVEQQMKVLQRTEGGTTKQAKDPLGLFSG